MNIIQHFYFYTVRTIIALLICNMSLNASDNNPNEKIVVISFRFQSSGNRMYGTPEITNRAYIISKEEEVQKIRSTIRKYQKGPAYLCSYDLIFLHFIDDTLAGGSPVNIECSKNTVGDFFEQYDLSKSYNANLYTLKMMPGHYTPQQIEKPENSLCFNADDENAPYPYFSVEFFNSNSKRVHRQKLRELIKRLEFIFPERLDIEHSSRTPKDSYGRAKVLLPIGFDSSKIAKITLPDIYKTKYIQPQYSYLYLITENTNLEELRTQMASDSLLSLDEMNYDK